MRKPKTHTTSGVKCKVHSGLVHYGSLCHCPCSGHAENRRLRGEVRRLRRVARKVASELRKSVFSMDQALAGMLEAALAPRRRKK